MFKRYKYIFCTTLLLLSVSLVSLYAQEKKIRFQYITSDNGLTHNMIDCMLLDSKGFMWFGTWNGLNRRASARGKFSSYFHNPGDPGSLIHNTVMSIIEDLNGNLIVGTLGGLGIYNEQKGKFDNFTSFSKSNYLHRLKT